MRTIKIEKRTQLETVCKAMSTICKRSTKLFKERLATIHYSAQFRRLEATDGVVMMVYEVPDFEDPDQEGFFSYQGGYLIEGPSVSYPQCERVIPEPGKANHKGETFGAVYNIEVGRSKIDMENFYTDAVCILGYLGIRFNPVFITEVKDLIPSMPILSIWNNRGEAVNYKPFVWSNTEGSLKYIVMPMNNEDRWEGYRLNETEPAENQEKATA